MKRRFLLYIVCLFSLYTKGQHTIEGTTKNASLNLTTVHSPIPTTKQLRSFFRVDYLTVPIEDKVSNMGLSGGHYNIFLNDWLYTGFGMYGAVSGDLGGLFTLGVEAGIKYRMAEKLFFDAGIYFGGGGGHSAPVGGGAFIVSSIGLGYDFKSFSIGTAYSSANFYQGSINGSQLKVFIDIPLNFNHAPYTYATKTYSSSTFLTSFWNKHASKNSFAFQFDTFFPRSSATTTDGITPLPSPINLVGFEFNHYISPKTLLFIKADGAYKGIKSGYMDVFMGLGYQINLGTLHTRLVSKFGVGAGGGGGVETNGGFLLYPSVALEQQLTRFFAIDLRGGYVFNPSSDFSSFTAGIGLKRYVFSGGLKNPENDAIYPTVTFDGWAFNLSNQTYLKAARINSENRSLSQIAIQFNYQLSKYSFLAGQAAFAYTGGAGAYAEGLIGAGINTSMFFDNTLLFFAQGLVGTGGGGGVHTEQGIILKPSVGVNYFIDDFLAVQTSISQTISPKGNLNTTGLTIGLSYFFSSLSAK